jgi:hypothetical protein
MRIRQYERRDQDKSTEVIEIQKINLVKSKRDFLPLKGKAEKGDNEYSSKEINGYQG